MKYSFHPYHSYFKKRAQNEISKLKVSLPRAQIEHVGSTSIPGVGGKGIIDLCASVPKETMEKSSQVIQKLGYVFKLSGGVPNERLFHQKTVFYPDGHKQTFHLHLTYIDSKDWKDMITFRNFLKRNSNLAKEYSDIKYKAVLEAKQFRNKKDKKKVYMNAKRPLINKIVRLIQKESITSQ
jgi:GrpB-like predicted nucleotidyltransferase (UPF0157 family)